MEIKKTEEEIADGILKGIENRGIKDTKAFLSYLRDQKIKKREASKARVTEAEMEIEVIDKMLEVAK